MSMINEILGNQIDNLPEGYISEILYHFWGKNDLDEDHQFRIFESIVKKGLLLTCSNQDLIDEFRYFRYTTGEIERVYLRQWARVCFTEVPQDKLALIRRKFGGFGLGFSRLTIIHWGGCPVWYLPNRFDHGTQYGRVSISMNNLRQLIDLLQSMKRNGCILNRNNQNLSVEESQKHLNDFIGTLYFLGSHFKGMTPPGGEDNQSFLYEKEWRIVFGLHYGPSESLFKTLSDEEKENLVTQV